MTIATDRQRTALIEGGRRLARVLEELGKQVAPGVSAQSLDDLAEKLIRDGGDTPAFLGYAPDGMHPYPASLCVSVNEEAAHGLPQAAKVIKEGDIVILDLGLVHDGMVVDSAITVPVGQVDERSQKLLDVTKAALSAGVAAAVPDGRVGDISHAVQRVVEKAGFTIIKALGGHGLGELVHEEPFIPNFGKAGTGPLLEEGMVLAIEPIVGTGKAAIMLAPDGFSFVTKDGSRVACFEHTIILENGGATPVTVSSR